MSASNHVTLSLGATAPNNSTSKKFFFSFEIGSHFRSFFAKKIIVQSELKHDYDLANQNCLQLIKLYKQRIKLISAIVKKERMVVEFELQR